MGIFPYLKAYVLCSGNKYNRTSGTATQSVNTVDTLFAAFPAFLYFNPELSGYLLSPLLKLQDSPAYTLDYAAKHIGAYDILLSHYLWCIKLVVTY